MLLLAVGACGKEVASPDLGPAKVVIESASKVDKYSVQVTLKNEGGTGSFYVEVSGFRSTPTGSAPTAQSDPVGIRTGYRETLTYSATFELSMVKVFSRGENTAVYSRTGCYYLHNGERC